MHTFIVTNFEEENIIVGNGNLEGFDNYKLSQAIIDSPDILKSDITIADAINLYLKLKSRHTHKHRHHKKKHNKKKINTKSIN